MVPTVISLPIRDHLLPIIGLGAAVSAALTYIVWGGNDPKEGESSRKVAGLENLGNTCYLNTILQSLAACPRFVKWLKRALQNNQFRGRREDLAYKLSKTLQVVNDFSSSHAGSRTFSPHDVLCALNKCDWKGGREQQDCHELFQFLVTELQADSERLSSSMILLSEAAQLDEGMKKNGFLSQASLRSSIEAHLPSICTRGIELPFRGLTAHHLSCTTCGHKHRVSYSQFDCLSLNIPYSSFGMTSLEQMLATFTQVELVEEVECSQCFKRMEAELASPNSPLKRSHSDRNLQNGQSEPPSSPLPICRRDFQKQMTLAKLPQCLCIHVQRSVWTPTGAPMRRGEHVMFPEMLDMSPFRHITGVGTENRQESVMNGLKGSSNFVRYCECLLPLSSLANLIAVYASPMCLLTLGSQEADTLMTLPRESSNGFIGGSFLKSPSSSPIMGQTINSLSRINNMYETKHRGMGNITNPKPFSRGNLQYQLMSAVVHTGDATSGHFLTYRRAPVPLADPVSRRWLCISDENVTTAALTDVLGQKAYMLYYQRI